MPSFPKIPDRLQEAYEPTVPYFINLANYLDGLVSLLEYDLEDLYHNKQLRTQMKNGQLLLKSLRKLAARTKDLRFKKNKIDNIESSWNSIIEGLRHYYEKKGTYAQPELHNLKTTTQENLEYLRTEYQRTK